MAFDYAVSWAKAWEAEVIWHTDELKTWNLEAPLESDKPLPYVMIFSSKTI